MDAIQSQRNKEYASGAHELPRTVVVLEAKHYCMGGKLCGYTLLKSEPVKPHAAILPLLLFSLWAADSWQSKPFTEWSNKEIRKVLTNSAWAHAVDAGAGEFADGRGSASPAGNQPQGADPSVGPGIMVPPAGSPSNPGVNASGQSLGGGALHLTIRWQSALPVKQALVRLKYGSGAAASTEAKAFIDQENSTYVIAVSGLPAAFAPTDAAKEETNLSAKGREPLQPTEIVRAPQGTLVDAYFVFPRSRPFTLEDKEVQFSTRLGSLRIKAAFHLNDMIYHSELAL